MCVATNRGALSLCVCLWCQFNVRPTHQSSSLTASRLRFSHFFYGTGAVIESMR